ncbi:C40 family peptidase [Pseudoclavibacter sp. 13-3]|uniref:C40 family peptidase n=1 Tax=Pseudoclavibacter sp. 13-3 TaxID=2901228 RepID=UPI001E3432DA|nr:NlpC/P60 family protein [Pseudoclavibacter sp. 13-3]
MKSRIIPGASAAGLALTTALWAGVWSGVPAVADPVTAPSQDDVNAAANDPGKRDSLVKQVQGTLDKLEADYNAAAQARSEAESQSAQVQQRLSDAIGSFVDLQVQVQNAQQTADASKRQAGQVTAQLARGGGSVANSQLSTVVGVADADDALKRMAALDKLGGDVDGKVKGALADANTLSALRDQTQSQQQALEQLADEYDQRTQAAQQTAQQAYDLFNGQTDEVVTLRGQLAQLQGQNADQAKQQAQAERTAAAQKIAPVSAGDEANFNTGAAPAVVQRPAAVAAPAASPAQTSSSPQHTSTSTSTPAPAQTSTPTPAAQTKPAATPTPTPAAPASTGSRGAAVVGTARQYLGTPYVWGGTTPAGFDCSGFTSWVFARNGVSLPRVSQAQMNVGTAVSIDQAQPGDLVWMNGGGHVGIYLGGNQVIHAPKPGDVVKISPLVGGWWSNWGIRRVL